MKEHGNSGHDIYILRNWDHTITALACLKQTFGEIRKVSLFLICSAACKTIISEKTIKQLELLEYVKEK